MEETRKERPVRAVCKVEILFDILKKDEKNNKEFSFITFFFRENMHIIERRDGFYFFDKKKYEDIEAIKKEVILEELPLEKIKDRITIVNFGTAQNIGPVPVNTEELLIDYLKHPEDIEYHLNMPNRYDKKDKYKKEKKNEMIAKTIIYVSSLLILMYIIYIIAIKFSDIIETVIK